MTLQEKLFKIRQEVGRIEKTKTNPFLKSNYFDINQLLEQLNPLFDKHDLLLIQPIRVVDGKNTIVTRIENIEDGQGCESIAIIPDTNDPQKMGSSITYLRRYTLQSLLGLQAADDDGNLAAGKTPIVEWQKTKIDNLIHTSTVEEDEKITIEGQMDGMTYDRANKAIEYLKENQKENLKEQLNKKL